MNAPHDPAPSRSAGWIGYPTIYTAPAPASGAPAAATPLPPAPEADWIEVAITCPITLDIMENPVIDPEGHSYDRAAILDWIARKGSSPYSRQPLRPEDLRPNFNLRDLRESFVSSRSLPTVPPAPDVSVLAAAASAGVGAPPAAPANDASCAGPPRDCPMPARETAVPSAPPWSAALEGPAPAVAAVAPVARVAAAPTAPAPSAVPARRVAPAPHVAAVAPASAVSRVASVPTAPRVAAVSPVASVPPAPRVAAPGRGTPERLSHLAKRPSDELHTELEAVWSEYSHVRHAFCASGEAQLQAWRGDLQAAQARAGSAGGWSERRAAKAEAKQLQDRLAKLTSILSDLRQHMRPTEGPRAPRPASHFPACREALANVTARLQATAKQVCKQEGAVERGAEFLGKALHKGPARDSEYAKAAKARGRVSVATAILQQLSGKAGKRG